MAQAGLESLFTAALGLQPPWEVDAVELETTNRRIDFKVTYKARRLACPACGEAEQGIHDRVRRYTPALPRATTNAATRCSVFRTLFRARGNREPARLITLGSARSVFCRQHIHKGLCHAQPHSRKIAIIAAAAAQRRTCGSPNGRTARNGPAHLSKAGERPSRPGPGPVCFGRFGAARRSGVGIGVIGPIVATPALRVSRQAAKGTAGCLAPAHAGLFGVGPTWPTAPAGRSRCG